MKKYEYMVVYNFANGTGRIQFITEKPIKTYDDIEEMDKIIRESNGRKGAFVIDFKLLREYEG